MATRTSTSSTSTLVMNDNGGTDTVDILEPRDADVLCGRGGAALRHPGNQTYRRLVHLNKGLYITCLKAEKLKISRSIVTAIREQNGRFLERNTVKGTWYDIGDKKAVEKTSQALREGQPKLRQKIVEMGGGAALLDNQVPSASTSAPAAARSTSPSIYDMTTQQQQQHQHQHMAHQTQGMMNNMGEMHASNQYDLTHDGILSRMSEMEMDTPTIHEESANFQDSLSSQLNSDLQDPSLQPYISTLSLMSEFSNFTRNNDNSLGQQPPPPPNHLTSPNSLMSQPPPPPPNHLSTPDSLMSPANFSCISSTYTGNGVTPQGGGDRRKHFAKMKFSHPQGGRYSVTSNSSNNQGSADGAGSYRQSGLYASNKQLYASNKSTLTDPSLPDFHTIDSNFSLFSNNHRYPSLVESTNTAATPMSNSQSNPPAFVPEVVPNQVFESRRSIMSGMSRISDTSDIHSIFSDLSRKIGNVSTRSFAMSEISVMDDLDRTMDDASSVPSHYF